MNTTYRNWLRAQLDLLNHPEPDLEDFDTFRHVLTEASRQSAELGHLEAVRACQVRSGPISPAIAREALTACLQALGSAKRQPKKQEAAELLTVQQAAAKFNVSTRTIYRLTKAEQLPSVRIGTSIRIKPGDLEKCLQDSQESLFD